MANIKSAKKRARQNVVRRHRNVSARSMLRTAIKKVLKACEAGNKEEAGVALKTAQPIIQRAATHGLIHANKASRHISRLNSRVKAL